MSTDHLFTVDPWPHQLKGCEETVFALSNGAKSVCLTAPTGSGKTHMMIALTRWATEQGKRVVLFTNRILLTAQTQREFLEAGVLAGVVAASMPQYEAEDAAVQIAGIQTVMSKRKKSPSYWLDADVVLVDEVHQCSNGESAALLNEYKERGAKVIGVTATPLGVSNVCDELIVAAGTRDLQDSEHLCYAEWFAPSELDTRNLTKTKVDLSIAENDARRTWGPLRGGDKVKAKVVGNIIEHYKRLHPRLIHTLAFAPGVKESLWAAQFCNSHGIRALHIDGQDFWCDGETYDRKRDDTRFQDCMEEWREGAIPIIWNRFVMREGIDEPRIECVMLATPVGSYRSFLQMVGRGLRVSEETLRKMMVLDFGGSWWRHGSPNINVDWDSVFDCQDPDILSKNRIAEHRETGDSVGQVCRKCGMVHKAMGRMVVCQYCGQKVSMGKPSRPIIQADGTLTEVNGEPIKQWAIKVEPDNEQMWAGLYHNAKRKGGITFNQLYSQFGYKTAVQAGSPTKPAFWKAHYPPRDLPLMPQGANTWHQYVSDVAREKLN